MTSFWNINAQIWFFFFFGGGVHFHSLSHFIYNDIINNLDYHFNNMTSDCGHQSLSFCYFHNAKMGHPKSYKKMFFIGKRLLIILCLHIKINKFTLEISSSWLARWALQCTQLYSLWHLVGKYAWNVLTIFTLSTRSSSKRPLSQNLVKNDKILSPIFVIFTVSSWIKLNPRAFLKS